MKFLEGKKTYLGIATSVLGFFLGEADVSLVVDSLDKVLMAVGAILAAYGRLKANPDTKSGTGTKPSRH